MWITHSYLGTTRSGTRCLFFLLFEDYLDAQRGLSDEVKTEIERFARNLCNFGAVVAPFPGDAPTTQRSVLDKQWTPEEKRELCQTPAMLMIDTDFDDFDPQRHSWVLFHFDRSSSYDGTYAAKLRSLLAKIVDSTSNQDSNPFEVVRGALRNEAVAHASKLFNIRPGAFGISVDLRAGWDALKEYLRSKNTVKH